jgi:hypothetical protein
MVFSPQGSTFLGCLRRSGDNTRSYPERPGLAQAYTHFGPVPRRRVNTMILVALSDAQIDTLTQRFEHASFVFTDEL